MRASLISRLVWLVALAVPVHAQVVRQEIEKRESFANGHAFGRSGPYERISGKLYIEVDPVLCQNSALLK